MRYSFTFDEVVTILGEHIAGKLNKSVLIDDIAITILSSPGKLPAGSLERNTIAFRVTEAPPEKKEP